MPFFLFHFFDWCLGGVACSGGSAAFQQFYPQHWLLTVLYKLKFFTHMFSPMSLFHLLQVRSG